MSLKLFRLVHCLAIVSGLLLADRMSDSAQAQPRPTGAGERPELRFRRFFVPEARISELARGALPIRREQFESWLRESQRAGALSPALSGPRLEQAIYGGRLSEADLLEGSAAWQVALEGSSAALLTLEQCALALERPRWAGDGEPATITTHRARPAALSVEQPGRLEFAWSLRGTRDEWGETVFSWESPPAPLTRLILDLPTELQLSVEGGVAVPAPPSAALDLPPHLPEQPPANFARWLIELGGRSKTSLRLSTLAEIRQERRLTFLRQSSQYSFAPSGGECRSKLTLDVFDEPLRRLLVRLEAPLQLAAVHWGDKQLTPLLHPTGDSGGVTAEINFPEPVLGVNRELHLLALMPLEFDQNFRLPGMEVENVTWQQGNVTLDVSGELQVNHLQVEGGREVKVTPLPAPVFGESRQFQLFRPQSLLELNLGLRTPALRGVAGTAVTAGPRAISARVLARLSATDDSVFQIEGRLADLWQVDAVETQPADALDTWNVVPGEGGRRLLRVALRKPVPRESTLTLKISGHRGTPANLQLRSEQLRVWQPLHGAAVRQLMALHTEAPLLLRVEGEPEFPRLDPQQLTAEEREALGPSAAALVYLDAPALPSFTVALSRERPEFSAAIQVLAEVDRGRLQETVAFRCQPDSSPIQRLLVRFSEIQTEELQWSLTGESPGAFTARRLTADERRAAGLGDGDGWELVFRQPRNSAFVVESRRVREFASEQSLALASLPEATSQSGVLLVGSREGKPLDIEAPQLPVLPVSSADARQYAQIQAAYRYDPSQTVRVRVGPGAVATIPQAWIASRNVRSQFAVNGLASHQAALLIENAGESRLRIQLPAHAELQDVLLDGRKLAWQPSGGEPKEVSIPLPPGVRFPHVELKYVTQGSPLQSLRSLEAALPETHLTCLTTCWDVWLPPGWELLPHPYQRTWDDRRPWVARLLGDFFRGAGSPPLPWSWAAWYPLSDRHPGAASLAARDAVRLQALTRELTRRFRSTTSQSWHRLLETWSVTLSQEFDRVLLCDTQSLAEWVPSVAGAESGSDAQRVSGGGPSRDGPWVLIVHPRAILLTTRAAAEAVPSELVATSQSGIFGLRPGALSAELERSLAEGAPFLTARQWSEQPELPWRRTPGAVPPSAWGSRRLQWNAVDSGGLALRIYRRELLSVLNWTTFLVTGGLLLAGARRCPWLLLLAAVLAAAAAWLVPPWGLGLVRAVFFAALVATAVHLLRRRRVEAGTPSESHSATVAMPLAPLPALVLLALLLGAMPSAGREPLSPEGSAEALRVLIPVDEQQQPVGEYLFVPRAIYDEIFRMPPESSAASGWSIGAAQYEAALEIDELTGQPVLSRLDATLDLTVAASNTDVFLPFQPSEAGVWRATWQGEPLVAEFQEAEQLLRLRCERSGRGSLVISLRPNVTSEAGWQSLSVRIPRHPQSQLVVHAAPELIQLQFPTAVGRTDADPQRGSYRVELGPAEQLALKWSSSYPDASENAAFRCEQLLWLKVRPNSVVLDAKLRITGPVETLRHLRLVTDARLRWLRSDQGGYTVTKQTREADRQLLDVALADPSGGTVELDGTFLLTGVSPIGNLSLPQLELQGIPTVRRRVGLSVAPAFTFQQTTSSELVSAADFVESWGGADAPPQVAFRLTEDDMFWGITTRPLEQQVVARQAQELTVGADRASLQFTGQLDFGETTFRCELLAPPALEIHSLQLATLGEGDPRPTAARWARQPSGTVEVFFEEGVRGSLRVELAASQRIAPRRAFEAPLVRVAGADLTESILRIFRRSDVLARVEQVAGWEAREETSLPVATDALRLIGAWQQPVAAEPPATPSLRLHMTMNRPRIEGGYVTHVTRAKELWQATLEAHLRVEDGTIDVLRFEIPTSWVEPFTVEPAARCLVRLASDHERRQLIVVPHTSIFGSTRLRIAGQVRAPASERFTVPHIVPLEPSSLPKFYALPRALEGQPLAWETSGLQQAEPPVNWSLPENHTLYEVAGPRPQATVSSVQRVAGSPQVLLADVRLALDRRGGAQGLTTLDLDPAGSRTCTLSLPPQVRLLYVALDDMPARLKQTAEDRWEVFLGPEFLPQRLTLFFTREADAAEATPAACSPWIEGWETRTTLWTVYQPLAADSEPMTQGNSSPQRLARIRWEHLHHLQAQLSLLETADERLAWWRPWQRRQEVVRASLRSWPEPDAPAGPNHGEILEGAEVEDPLTAVVEGSRPPLADSAAIWEAAVAPHSLRGVWEFSSGQPTLQVSRLADGSAWGAGRWAALFALLLLLLCGVGYRWSRYRAQDDRVWLAPATVGVLLGLAWWLVLSPSGLGWVIIAGVLLRSYWPVWRKRL